ncbi:NAD(P)/FAD-dependent oxidoreductase [Thermophilibacter sp. ET337]|uniref:FAD-dependent oxidoreductase n=1 Tax=Thermophilibacter sp. ET337 TaxID=2973084 RepID=UPI0021AD021B|nr:FAD-dependent oxidoreductase [Thermophilibacter sp. ET337]MCR8907246.1 NAD(P)/FAD-dependent oxidoreductase [Thermophilibacter sp. ET337]
MARGQRRTSRSQAREEALAAAAAVRVPERCDVAVVGGGAAGLAAAIAAAEAGASVVVLERALACGRSILATGNGRCNFMNAALCGPAPAWERYNDPSFVATTCGPRFGDDVLAFFEECGLAWAEEEGGRLYPLSRQASSVREVLLSRARRAGVVLAPAREVVDVSMSRREVRTSPLFEPDSRSKTGLMRTSLVLAAGGGEGVTRSIGLACAPYEPVLCSLACSAPAGVALEGLDGRRAHVVARLVRDGAEVARETGEVLFRSYGLSGIAVFDLSRVVLPGDVVALDLTGGLDRELARGLGRAAGSCAGVLDPVIAAALGPDALEKAFDLRFVVQGPAEPERAQVTRGGLLCSQFRPETLEAREASGLFACGEALNVDGACGGYNLAWAWKSGLVAGRAAAESAGSRA